MASVTNKLSAPQITNAKPKDKDYKLSDGGGLYLLIKVNGAKYWRLKYRMQGKEKILAIGVFPEVSLKEARQTRDSAREQLRNGVDPSVEKMAKRMADTIDQNNRFQTVGLEWFEVKMAADGDGNRLPHLDKQIDGIFKAKSRRGDANLDLHEIEAVLERELHHRNIVKPEQSYSARLIGLVCVKTPLLPV